jgi:predicted MFS family arabinose efflux permease
MIVIGAPLGGLLGDAIGFRPLLGLAAAGFLAVAVAFAVSPYRDARLEDVPVP